MSNAFLPEIKFDGIPEEPFSCCIVAYDSISNEEHEYYGNSIEHAIEELSRDYSGTSDSSDDVRILSVKLTYVHEPTILERRAINDKLREFNKRRNEVAKRTEHLRNSEQYYAALEKWHAKYIELEKQSADFQISAYVKKMNELLKHRPKAP